MTLGIYCITLRDTIQLFNISTHLVQYSARGAFFSLQNRSGQVYNVVFTETTAPTAVEGLRTTTPQLVSPQLCSSSQSESSSAASSKRDNVSSATGPPHKLHCAQSTFPIYSISRLPLAILI